MSAARAPSEPPKAAPAARKEAPPATEWDIGHIRVPEAGETASVDSPARALQSQLERRLQQTGPSSARRVMATVLVLCLACWLAGFWLVSAL
ncbi:MAG: hypothetical protein R3B98_06905 [Hyphomonas sp.]